jgi:hypothetical protein
MRQAVSATAASFATWATSTAPVFAATKPLNAVCISGMRPRARAKAIPGHGSGVSVCFAASPSPRGRFQTPAAGKAPTFRQR